MENKQATLLLLLLLTSVYTNGQTQPGLKVTVSKNTLDKLNEIEVNKLQAQISTLRFPDDSGESGDVSWSLSNIRVSSAGTVSSNIQLGSGSFTRTAGISHLRVSADWWYQYETGGWINIKISDSGDLSVSVGSSSIRITVRPVVQSNSLKVHLESCSASLSGLDIDIGGSWAEWLYDFLVDAFESDIERNLENQLCESVRSTMMEVSMQLTDVQTTSIVKAFGTEFTIDNAITNVEITSQHIATYHKAAIIWSGRMIPITTQSFSQINIGNGVAFDLDEEFFNNVLKVAVANNFLEVSIGYREVMDNNMKLMHLSCDKSFCIGHLLPKARDMWPKRVVGMRAYVSNVTITFGSSSAVLHIDGRLNFTAENASDVDQMFSAKCNLSLPVQVKFTNGSLSAKLANISGQIIVDESNIGKVLNPGLENLFDVLAPNLTKILVAYLNNNPVSYDIHLPRDILFKTSDVRLYQHDLRVEANLCQKGTVGCAYTINDKWVGQSNGDVLTVIDILTTTTTTTTATTTTTSTTPTTASTSITRTATSSTLRQKTTKATTIDPPSFERTSPRLLINVSSKNVKHSSGGCKNSLTLSLLLVHCVYFCFN